MCIFINIINDLASTTQKHWFALVWFYDYKISFFRLKVFVNGEEKAVLDWLSTDKKINLGQISVCTLQTINIKIK